MIVTDEEEAAEAEDHSIVVADPLPALRWLIETAQQLDDEDLAMVTTLAQKLLTRAREWEGLRE